jgi:predicted glycosyltransferase
MAHIKVYIFCQSEVGTGHYVRCNNIRKGLDDCNLQSISGNYTNEELKEVFAKQLKIINDYKPDVLLFDGFPFMRYPWMKSGLDFVLECVKNTWKDIKIVSSVRDICYPYQGGKGSNHYSALTTDWANEYFDAILVHGDKNFIKLDESFEHLNLIDPPVYYTGYVTDPYKPKPQKRNGTVVSAGGGRVAMDCFDKAMELYDGTDWTFSVGPNMNDLTLQKLLKWAGDKKLNAIMPELKPMYTFKKMTRPKVEIVYNVKNFRDLLVKYKLSISQAGYNTVMDLLMTDTPAKFIPYVDKDGEQEQTTRARLIDNMKIKPDMNGVEKTKQLLEKICEN